MKNPLVFVLFFMVFKCNAQSEEKVYLLYEPDIEKSCNYSMFRDGSSPKKFSYKDQKIKKDEEYLIFEMCDTYFRHSSINMDSKKIASLKGLNIVNIANIFTALENNRSNPGKSTIYKQIYVVEKISDENYLLYEVEWVDKYR